MEFNKDLVFDINKIAEFVFGNPMIEQMRLRLLNHINLTILTTK